MTTIHSQIVERASNFYDEVRKSFFGVAENIFDNSTTFDTCNRVFNQYSCTGNDFVHPFVSGAQLLAFWLFFGWKVRIPFGS